MSTRIVRRVLFAGIAAGLVYVVFFPGRYKVMDRPNEQSFVGRWILDPESIPSVRRHAGRPPSGSELVFGSNGSLIVADMPYETNSALLPDAELVSSTGTWRLELHQDWVMTFALGDRRGGTLFIELKDGMPAMLTHGVLDPDSSERWVWRKAP